MIRSKYPKLLGTLKEGYTYNRTRNGKCEMVENITRRTISSQAPKGNYGEGSQTREGTLFQREESIVVLAQMLKGYSQPHEPHVLRRIPQ